MALNRLSPGLRQAINALVGNRLNRAQIGELASRLEAEQPEFVVAVRNVLRPDGEVRVIFLVARISDDRDISSNINARYTVDSVEISGIPDTAVSQELRDDMQALVGDRLDPDEADRLRDRLAAELPEYNVRRRVSRGRRSARVRVIFVVSEIETPPWIDFAASRSKLVYHSTLGWSGVLDIPMGGRDNRLTLGLVGDNDDDLLEEYSGYRVRLESRKVATERLALSIEFAELRQSWRDATLSAAALNPQIAAVYRERRTIEPMVTVAFSPHVRVSYGGQRHRAGIAVPIVRFADGEHRELLDRVRPALGAGVRSDGGSRSELRAARRDDGARERPGLQAASRSGAVPVQRWTESLAALGSRWFCRRPRVPMRSTYEQHAPHHRRR